MILVVGSTGYLGVKVAKNLLAEGKAVRALVRDPQSEKAAELQAAGAQLAVGDLKDRPGIEKALEGVDTVVCSATAVASRRAGDNFDSVDRDGIAGLIEAAEKAGIKRFVYVSFTPAIAEDFPLARGKRACERRLEASKLDYVILQPSFLLDTWTNPVAGFDVAAGKVRVYGSGDAKVSYVSADDVAKAVVAAVDNSSVARQKVPLGGGKAVSQNELVQFFEHATAKPIAVEHMSEEQIAGARAASTDPMTSTFLGLFATLARGDELPQDGNAKLGIQPMSPENWVQSQYVARRA